MALPSPFALSLFPSRTPAASPILEPTPKELARYGKGTLILPTGVETPEGLLNSLGGATLLGPDGIPVFMSHDDSAGFGGLVQHPSASTDVASATPPHGTATTGAPLTLRSLTPPGMSIKRNGDLGKQAHFNLWVQGVPLALGCWGDIAKAQAVALNMLASGTFRNDPLGTQDPDSVMSLPLQALSGDYWGQPLTPDLRKRLDVDSAEDSVENTFSKSLRYLVGIYASMEAIAKVEERGSKDPTKKRLMVLMDYYAALSNAGFLGEKLLAVPCLAAITLAQVAGENSVWWDIGYISSALFVNAGLMLSNMAWYAKLRSGFHLLQLEQYGFAKAQAEGRDFDLNGAHVASFTFDFANAVPRVAKHVVAHVSTLALITYMYAPEAFDWVGNADYLNDAVERMGGEVTAHAIYRWANFGFAVPMLQTILGTLIASYAAFGNGRGALTKLSLDKTKLRDLNGRPDDETFVAGAKPQTVGERRRQLKREVVADRFSLAGALGLVGVGLTVAYPPLEHLDLVCAAVFGGGTFGAYCAREWPAITALTNRAIAFTNRKVKHMGRQALHAMGTPGEDPKLTTVGSVEATEAMIVRPKLSWRERGNKLWRDFRNARSVVKAYNEESLASLRDLPWYQRWRARLSQLRQAQRDWSAFVRAYYQRDKKPSWTQRALSVVGIGRNGT